MDKYLFCLGLLPPFHQRSQLYLWEIVSKASVRNCQMWSCQTECCSHQRLLGVLLFASVLRLTEVLPNSAVLPLGEFLIPEDLKIRAILYCNDCAFIPIKRRSWGVEVCMLKLCFGHSAFCQHLTSVFIFWTLLNGLYASVQFQE